MSQRQEKPLGMHLPPKLAQDLRAGLEKKPDDLLTKNKNTLLSLYVFLHVNPSPAAYIKPDGSRPRGKKIETLDSLCILYTAGFSSVIVRLQE